MYKVQFGRPTGTLKKISGILGLSFWELLMSPPHGTSDGICPTWILDFCTKISGLISWLVYSITERLFLTHSINRNYHFTNPTPSFRLDAFPRLKNPFCLTIYPQLSEEDIWYLRVVSLRAFNVTASRNARWNLSDWILCQDLRFCVNTQDFASRLTWFVNPITESISLTYSIHRNYHFTNPTILFNFRVNSLNSVLT